MGEGRGELPAVLLAASSDKSSATDCRETNRAFFSSKADFGEVFLQARHTLRRLEVTLGRLPAFPAKRIQLTLEIVHL